MNAFGSGSPDLSDARAARRPVCGLALWALVAGTALIAHGIALAATGRPRTLAVDVGWTLAGVLAVCGTASAGRALRGQPRARPWLIWSGAAAVWLVGTLVLDGLSLTGHASLSLWAGAPWLLFAVLATTGVAIRAPRAFVFRLFLLDALPPVMLAVAAMVATSGREMGGDLWLEARIVAFPVAYGALALVAWQLFTSAGLRRTSRPSLGLLVGFSLAALAALVWIPETARHGAAQGNPSDVLWSAALLAVGLAGFLRAGNPEAATRFPPSRRDSGLRALPPIVAVLALATLSFVPSRDPSMTRTLLLSAIAALSMRFYLVRREGVRLLDEVSHAREAARLDAERQRRTGERLRSLIASNYQVSTLDLDKLLQNLCDAARDLLGARYAALSVRGSGESELEHFFTSGIDEATRTRMGALPSGRGLLGVMIDSDGPLRLARLAAHPASAGFPAGHPAMSSFLGTPIRVSGQLYGAFYLTEKSGGFNDEDEMLLEILATEAGYMIANAQLYRQALAYQADLARRNDQLEELDRLKDRFLATVTHDLRTPLTATLGYLELLLEPETGELNERQAGHVNVAVRNAERLLGLVNDLLFVAEAEAGTLSFEPAEIDLAALAGDAVEGVRPLAEKKGLALGARIQASPRVAGSRELLDRLLANLLSNAIKFTPEGSVEVRVAQRGEDAVLEVADTGLGMTAEACDQLFERFYRAPEARRLRIQGTGLGLTITKDIVAAHGGTIEVRSAPGRGTTFAVRLPLSGAGLSGAAEVAHDEQAA